MSDIDTTTPTYSVPLWRGGTWEELTADAHVAFGADLEQGDHLVGVPFAMVKATFRPGDYLNAKTGLRGAYVSLDSVIGTAHDIARAVRRGRITQDQADLFEPGEQVVFNEGGTGVYRQVVGYLESLGRIRIDSELPQEGPYGDSRFDIDPGKWTVAADTEQRYGPDGEPTLGFNIRLVCPRGLRASDYTNDYTQTGRTRYIG